MGHWGLSYQIIFIDRRDAEGTTSGIPRAHSMLCYDMIQSLDSRVHYRVQSTDNWDRVSELFVTNRFDSSTLVPHSPHLYDLIVSYTHTVVVRTPDFQSIPKRAISLFQPPSLSHDAPSRAAQPPSLQPPASTL